MSREPILVGAAVVDLVQVSRKRMLAEGWKLAACLTDLPLNVGRRPVTAYASAVLGVGLVSCRCRRSARSPSSNVSARRCCASSTDCSARASPAAATPAGDRRRTSRMRGRLQELSSPFGREVVQDERTIRFVTAVGRGNLRLLVGMVRANRPWRLVVGLTCLVAALGTAAFGLSSPEVWRLADGMGWPRQVALCLGSVLATVGSALGAAVENDTVVREAAYGYRPDERTESGSDGE
jgi:hypothetical protein